LLYYEVTNALYLYQRLERLSEVAVRRALEATLALPIKLYGTKNLHRKAVDMAVGYGLKATYDAHYLALAEQLEADFWTSDRRLARTVQAHLEWVHLLE
jgi:predicted nucleic acid-binding protein